VKVLYFAWIRERAGCAEEEIDPPAEVVTVADLVDWLKGRGEEFEYAFEDDSIIRVAVDRTHAPMTTPLAGAREIAFFPPMTGG
jgi:sulfur-carrier protein